MTSEIDKLKHFHIENYSGTNFTDDLNDGEEFLYTTIRCKDGKEVTLLCKYIKNKHIGNCPDCVFNKYLCYGLYGNFSFSRDVLLEQINDKFTEKYPEQSARLREETGGYFTLDDLDCIKVKFEIEKPIGDLANKINFDLLNTFFNHQHEMTRSSSINKTTMKNILNDGRDISIAKLVENTSLIIK
nr:MAG: hypothetical protein [Bacteriophage sp.]